MPIDPEDLPRTVEEIQEAVVLLAEMFTSLSVAMLEIAKALEDDVKSMEIRRSLVHLSGMVEKFQALHFPGDD